MEKFLNELKRLALVPVTVPRNPRVAALVVNSNKKIIASGVHRGKGSDHAEVVALRQLSEDLSGCTLYVSLEPCHHQGATPPCTEAIIKSGISKVVIGSLDPNPVSNGGLKTLNDAGIEVMVWSDQSEFVRLNRRWFESIRLKRPFVLVKTAISIDGFITKNKEQRYQLTSKAAFDYSQELRTDFDAILVGSNTAQVDNPRLTIRKSATEQFIQPLRVIMGRRELNPNLNIFNNEAKTIQIESHDPKGVLSQLWELGVHSLLVEGGAAVHSAFLRAGLVDEINILMSNKILGQGLNMFEQINDIAPHLEINFKNVISLDPDVLIQADVFGS